MNGSLDMHAGVLDINSRNLYCKCKKQICVLQAKWSLLPNDPQSGPCYQMIHKVVPVTKLSTKWSLLPNYPQSGPCYQTRLLGRPQPQMYPPVALNQHTLVNRTHKHYIYMFQGPTNILKSHQSSTICKICK